MSAPDAARRREERFVRTRVERWQELRQKIDLAHQRGFRRFDDDEVARFGSLYRAVTTDLALARSIGVSAETVSHLNRLCASAHDRIYSASRPRTGLRVVEFVASGFPRLVRRTWRYHAVAAAVLLGAVLLAYVALSSDPALARQSAGEEMYRRALSARELADSASRYVEMPSLSRPFFGWGLIANNVRVALMMTALGVTAGIGTLLLLFMNGLHIGGALAVFVEVGVEDSLLTWMAAHGPFELTALTIAAGGGLWLGLAPLLPGQRTRGAAFRETAVGAMHLFGGATLLLVVAGILESMVSPAESIPPPGKWAVGLATLLLLAAYLTFAGRPRTSQ